MNLVFNKRVAQNGVYYLCYWLFLAVLIHTLYLFLFFFLFAAKSRVKISRTSQKEASVGSGQIKCNTSNNVLTNVRSCLPF